MKITYNWLKDFVDIDVSAQQLAIKLTNAGMEVEEIIYQNEHLHHVVVGRIIKIEKHPEADRLVVCRVDIGGGEVTQIITAATNVFEGAVVPVSLEGADLVNGIKIKKAKMRGVESCGMFCSGEELGIDENYYPGAGVNGILILPSDLKPGTPIDEALMLNDIVFDINITPNRADCMSVVGLAREVCALLGKEMKKINLNYDIDVYSKDTVRGLVNVDVKTDNCLRYMTGAITDVKIERSPLWMRSRLNAVGIKPICTLVDITNYVLVEFGQPLHAFDADKIGGRKINVRQAEEGEKILALNHSEYSLDSDTMVVADDSHPMVIAGVIGGEDSCISEGTKNCVLESAVFDLKSIRITSRKLGVRTDSSARFEKGVNVANAESGFARAMHLITKLKCGKIARGVIDICKCKNETRHIVGSIKLINDILGIDVPTSEMARILNSLGIVTKVMGRNLECDIPPYREDISNEYDLAEEIIRLYGYDKYDDMDYVLFKNAVVTEGCHNAKLLLERKFRNELASKGFYENISYSLVSGDINKKLLLNEDENRIVRIANPISEDISCMRTSLAHSLFNNICYNLSVGNKDLRIFECGRTYKAENVPLEKLPVEEDMVGLSVCENGYDFYRLKGVIEGLLEHTSLNYNLSRSKKPYLHPGVSADIVCGDTIVGSFGKIHPVVAKNYDVPTFTLYAELNTGYLSSLPEKVRKFKSISKYPIVERDLAIIVDEEVTVGELLSTIKSACGKLYYDVKLFDIYRNDAIGNDKKSLAFNIKLSDMDKTLTDEEVKGVMNKVLKALTFKHKAVLR